MANHYEVPSWASKPPQGLHLDVLKVDKMIQKLMIDQKKCYLFGRNPQMNDFCIDHASCSRVHAALIYHKNLERSFLVDLGSTHGTFIGNMRLESNKPTQLPIDSIFHFGASTRHYILRERPASVAPRPIMEELEKSTSDSEGALLGLPDTELDNLTEFNTAHNRRISMLGIPDQETKRSKSKKKKRITFNEDDEVINPEDVDPSVGKFRNLVQSTLLPSNKRPRLGLVPINPVFKQYAPKNPSLYDDLPPESATSSAEQYFSNLSSQLGLPLPNPAPEIESSKEEEPEVLHNIPLPPPPPPPPHVAQIDPEGDELPQKKKYAKEAWPGKKNAPPSTNLLV